MNTCLPRITILLSVGSTVKKSVVISGLHSEGLKGWGKVGEDFSRTGSLVSANHSSSLISPFLANFLTCMPHLFLVGFTTDYFKQTHNLCQINLLCSTRPIICVCFLYRFFFENCFCCFFASAFTSITVVSIDSSSVSLSSAKCS